MYSGNVCGAGLSFLGRGVGGIPTSANSPNFGFGFIPCVAYVFEDQCRELAPILYGRIVN